MKQIPPPQLPPGSAAAPTVPTPDPSPSTQLQHPRQCTLPADALRIRACAVPASAPPFDDEGTQAGNGADFGAAWRPPHEDQVAVDLVDPGPDTPEPDAHDESDQERPEGPPGWPSQFAQAVAEALAGSRPARQLMPWTTERARRRIRQLGPMLATNQRPTVRRVMTSAPAVDVLEVTAVVRFGPRLRVLALRLELEQPRAYRQGGSRWCCTAIESA
jgi:Family of unknown function (DUF6459)